MSVVKERKISCFLCGNNEDFIHLSPDYCSTSNYLCNKCGLVFIPREDSYLKSYYKDDGYFKKSPNFASRPFFVSKSLLSSLGVVQVSKIVKLLGSIDKDSSVLDIGCGYGENLYILKRDFGCKVFGLEPSEMTAKTGRSFFNIDISSSLLEDHNFKRDKFDIIICNHVLEHVTDPLSFLIKIKSLLTTNGLLYLEVPNIFKPSGGFSLNSFLYYEHLQTFSSYSLSLLLKKAGFYIKDYSDKTFLSFVVSANSKYSNTRKISIPDTSGETIKFFQSYKNNFSIFSYFRIYVNKFFYLLKLLYFKILKNDKINE
jgi:2-polyprenyl-3-methyl-5-hydroxy-6-metoxy-1,4-benzoquinol methylase